MIDYYVYLVNHCAYIHDGSNYTRLDKLLQEDIRGFLSGKYPKCNALLHPI